MARAGDIVFNVRVDFRGVLASAAHVHYSFVRLEARRLARWRRIVDTPHIIDARDTAYTLADAAKGPAPWDVTR